MSGRFDGLSDRQANVFEVIAIGGDPGYCHPKTIEALVAKGYIVEVGKRVISRDRFGTVEAPVYDVPIDVHMRWCEWCAAQPDTEGVSP